MSEIQVEVCFTDKLESVAWAESRWKSRKP